MFRGGVHPHGACVIRRLLDRLAKEQRPERSVPAAPLPGQIDSMPRHFPAR